MLIQYLLVINIIAFCLFGLDKYRARRQLYRISEKTLLMVALAGGTAGAWVGMYFWHHKTKHRQFTLGVPVMMLAQIMLVYFFYGQY